MNESKLSSKEDTLTSIEGEVAQKWHDLLFFLIKNILQCWDVHMNEENNKKDLKMWGIWFLKLAYRHITAIGISEGNSEMLKMGWRSHTCEKKLCLKDT